MHISEGVLSPVFLTAGTVLAVSGTAMGLKKIDMDRITHVGLLSAVFFVASLIHVNLGPSSVHLCLSGLVGLLLGWAAFPAILVALALQAVFFQYGGLTVLGVNTVNMAFPALLGYYLCRPLVLKSKTTAMFGAFICGAGAVLLTSIMVAASLIYVEESFLEVAWLLVISHILVMLIEGVVTAFCVGFLKKVHPEIFYTCVPLYTDHR